MARSAPGGSLTGRALILFTVLGLLVVALSVPVRNWLTQRAEVASLRSDIASSTEQIELLNSELDRWSDPAFISSEARRRLHFLLPGETGDHHLPGWSAGGVAVVDDAADFVWHSVLWESSSSRRSSRCFPEVGGRRVGLPCTTVTFQRSNVDRSHTPGCLDVSYRCPGNPRWSPLLPG